MWKNALVKSNDSITIALDAINRGAIRSAFVVDSDMTLLGMVTDGDVRRALLQGVGLDVEVSSIMNVAPTVCQREHFSVDRVKALLETHHFLHLPIVEGNILVDVVSLEELHTTKVIDNPVFIMAGGFGTRLRPLTDNCPKPMLHVGGKPMLERIIDRFIRQGFHRFYLSTHFMANTIKDYFGDGSKWGVSIEYVHEEEPLGTGGALGLLPSNIGDLPLILMNGDILTKVSFSRLLDFHTARGVSATMCVREYEHRVPFGVVSIDGVLVAEMVEKPIQRFFVNAGIYVVEPKLVRQVEPKTKIDMPTLLQKDMDEGGAVGTFPIYEYWLDIGQMADFERAQKDVEEFFS